MPRLEIKGEICSNDHKAIYDYLGMEATCPKDVMSVISGMQPGETLDIYINSPGGEIFNGSEIYSAIREASAEKDIRMHVVGLAGSAASIIAMACPCDMSNTAMMMVHCVSTIAAGNHKDMEDTAEMLKSADEALCSAYMAKSGMSKEDALSMMEKTTWLTAADAVELGLVDSLMFEDTAGPQQFTNSFSGMSLTPEQIAEARKALAAKAAEPKLEEPDRMAEFLFNQNRLKLRARTNTNL